MMMRNPLCGYTIRLSKHAQKAFERLSGRLQEQVLEKLTQLTAPNHHLDIKKMEGFKKFYRIRCGDYRIVYEQQSTVIIVYVIFIGHRKSIYQELKRLF